MRYYSFGRFLRMMWFGCSFKKTLKCYDFVEFLIIVSAVWVVGGSGIVFIWNFVPISNFLNDALGGVFGQVPQYRPKWHEIVAKGFFALGVYGTFLQYRETRLFSKHPEKLKIPHEFSRLFFLKQEKPNIKLGNNLHPVYDTEFSGVKRVIGLSGTQVKNYFLELAMVDELPDPQAFKRALYEEGKVVFIDLFLYCIKTRWGEIRLHGPAFDQKPNPALTWVIEAPTEMVREHADGKGKWELRFE